MASLRRAGNFPHFQRRLSLRRESEKESLTASATTRAASTMTALITQSEVGVASAEGGFRRGFGVCSFGCCLFLLVGVRVRVDEPL